MFSGLKPLRYRCFIPECDDQSAIVRISRVSSVPAKNKTIFMRGAEGDLDFCRTRPLDSSITHTVAKCTTNDFNMTGDPIECNAQLTNLVYDKFCMKSTVVTEFNLFCNEEYKVSTTKMM